MYAYICIYIHVMTNNSLHNFPASFTLFDNMIDFINVWVLPHDVLINSIFSSAYTKLESKLWKETSACRNTQEPVEKNII